MAARKLCCGGEAARVNNASGGNIERCHSGREENVQHFTRRAGKRRAGAGRKLLVVIANNYGCIQELLAAAAVVPLLCSRCVQNQGQRQLLSWNLSGKFGPE